MSDAAELCEVGPTLKRPNTQLVLDKQTENVCRLDAEFLAQQGIVRRRPTPSSAMSSSTILNGLIGGANGFIGGAVAAALIAAGHTLVYQALDGAG
jgi:hypothetical protein